MYKDLEIRIDSIKEILSNMPKNNKKNVNKILEYINSLVNDYEKDLDNVLIELNKRYDFPHLAIPVITLIKPFF